MLENPLSRLVAFWEIISRFQAARGLPHLMIYKFWIYMLRASYSLPYAEREKFPVLKYGEPN